MKQKTSLVQTFTIGVTLFSMFFGAGNLIFAPFMGAQAGSQTPWALLGFICTAVVLPIAAVIIISHYEDALDMVSAISPGFARVFITLIYLLIGPCIAIPRTASTSFEMFHYLFGSQLGIRLLYTGIFFALAALSALHPGRLKDILGRIMGPILIVLVLLLCGAGLWGSAALPIQKAAGAYSSLPFVTGFVEGYQTMDILAAYCFGIVILLNIRQLGITQPSRQRSLLVKAAFIAGIMLASIYALLAFTGMKYSGSYASLNNGALILSALAAQLFGTFGQVLISLIFLCACYNVCSGLLSCCAQYFHELTGWKSYTWWLILFTLAGAGVSVFGLNWILAISAPILSLICPIAILLLAWGWVQSRTRSQ